MINENQQLSPQNLTPSQTSFLRRNWLTIIIGILGIGFTYYFYQLSMSEREPIFLTDPIKTIVIDSKALPKTTLKVLKENNIPVQGDIISLRFYFWNNGKQPIRNEHILTPLTISLSDKGGEILDYKLLALSRKEVINAKIERNEVNPETSLNISFRILEKNDGCTGQIIYSGDPNAKLIIKGVIEGVKEIGTNPSLLKVRFYKHMLLNLVLPLLVIIIFFIIPFWLMVFGKRARASFQNIFEAFANVLDKIFPDKISPKVAKVGRMLAIAIPIVILIIVALLAGNYEYQRSQEEINKSLTRIVPNEIKP